MWRIVVPASCGLNGAKPPYGRGMPSGWRAGWLMPSGMYAFGLASAVERKMLFGCCMDPGMAMLDWSIIAMLLAVSLSRSRRYRVLSASSVGAWPCSTLNLASSSSFMERAFSACSFMAVAWCMLSSETVAIIRRVTSRMRAWNSLICFASATASALPAFAWDRSFSVSVLTSSSTRSFSSKASRFSLRRSSSTLILLASCSTSGSSPSKPRHLSVFPGSSSAAHSSSVMLFSNESSCERATTLSLNSGRLELCFLATSFCRSISLDWRRSRRISSSFSLRAISPRFRVSSWRLAFSYKMHSSSLRSISCTPVMLRASTASSNCRFSLSISPSKLLIILFSLSISTICCSTFSCCRRYSAWALLVSRRSASRCVCAAWRAACSFWSALSLAPDSARRMSTSFCRMRIFSRISACAWLLL
mmetsp:Transcript_30225/g.96414  ORF Transcript_30225/g.96414 Transcript_30225/m.96414 type:complete len:419 (-) Transcript_30225:1584-2840(-)